MRSAAAEAAKVLGDEWIATTRLNLVADAPDEEVAPRVRQVAGALGFEPLMEAETPPDWPVPTVVGEVEIKTYPKHRLARVEGRGAFGRLFRHIQSHDIPMTTPVGMTREQQGSMSFLYPDDATGTLGPDQEGVEVVDEPAQTVVSFGVRGNLGEKQIAQAERILRAWLASQEAYEPTGDLRTYGYNSPFVPAPARYSEVQIPVRKVAAGDR
jgi:hypothetical protein